MTLLNFSKDIPQQLWDLDLPDGFVLMFLTDLDAINQLFDREYINEQQRTALYVKLEHKIKNGIKIAKGPNFELEI